MKKNNIQKKKDINKKDERLSWSIKFIYVNKSESENKQIKTSDSNQND